MLTPMIVFMVAGMARVHENVETGIAAKPSTAKRRGNQQGAPKFFRNISTARISFFALPER